ncbi:3-hydroxyanthranilate 3,4-dioxygenase [Hypsibius exemplaris]|uniref:3-hydroxyanthranilate 3,4-dioxygenase n=1 Tax=Hypsibius exemplaris TaxID=2072580 RepID=A0A1W0WKI4_HYPEX|nr:3-hydroxyanthranilate 3,4-dioxygenase [Hypsibius exemplaris]
MTDIPAFNHIPTWLEENRNAFAPPVCNKLMHGPNGQLFVMYVGGPNTRKDFHLEEGEEIFYMLKGDMCLKVQERGIFKDISIKEGEIFLLPGRIPHSPQRQADTVGLVIERRREASEEDCIRYYMDSPQQSNTLFERWLHCTNLSTQIAVVIKEFFASEEYATGRPAASSVDPHPPFFPDNQRQLDAPFSLNDWLSENAEKIRTLGKVRLFAERDYQSDVWVVGGAERFAGNPDAEHWVWQLRGETRLVCDEGDESNLESRHYRLAEDSAFLMPCGKAFRLSPTTQANEGTYSYTMVVLMDSANKKRVRTD